ncbi:MAG: hypothetical protein ABIG39_02865 [Candidatus Micrarchaeota archaeon]
MQRILSIMVLAILVLGCPSLQQETGQEAQGQQLVFIINETGENETLANNTYPSPPPPPESRITDFGIRMDKDEYSSQETANISVDITVDGDIPGVLVSVHGVITTRERELLNKDQLLFLRPESNTANFTLMLPYCSSCSGMPPGTYLIYAKATKDNETLAETNHSFNFIR